GKYLQDHGVQIKDFNSYGARRGNHEVMMRGTFANIRIKNEMLAGKEGGFTKYLLNNEIMSIYDAAMKYQKEKISLVVIAGKEYGTGSSRDWAAKGPSLLGVRAVLAESFERIHRSNLVGMGILPLEFHENINRLTLKLRGDETFTIKGLSASLKPKAILTVVMTRADKSTEEIKMHLRIDTENEVEYYRHGGILQYMIRNML
ncbi:MAG: aconitate hydratase, partial [uncultured bacterium]